MKDKEELALFYYEGKSMMVISMVESQGICFKYNETFQTLNVQ